MTWACMDCHPRVVGSDVSHGLCWRHALYRRLALECRDARERARSALRTLTPVGWAMAFGFLYVFGQLVRYWIS